MHHGACVDALVNSTTYWQREINDVNNDSTDDDNDVFLDDDDGDNDYECDRCVRRHLALPEEHKLQVFLQW